jgi:biotin transport system substrate-specific component
MNTLLADHFVALLTRSVQITTLAVRRIAAEIALVALGIAWVVALAQVVIPLPFTPVMLSLGTFGALSLGGAYGAKRSLITLSTYWALGIVGVPVFQGFKSGMSVTAGYAFGFIIAAVIVGKISESAAQKSHLKTFAAWAIASAVILLLGAAWLTYSMHLTVQQGVLKGIIPFIIGDTIKAIVAAGIFPLGYKIVNKFSHEGKGQ